MLRSDFGTEALHTKHYAIKNSLWHWGFQNLQNVKINFLIAYGVEWEAGIDYISASSARLEATTECSERE